MTTAPTRRSRRRRTLLFIALALIAIRIALPWVLLHLLNDRLANMKGYYGHAQDLDLALFRGAYRIEGIYLDRMDTTRMQRTPFLGAGVIDLSVEWKALFHGSVVGELVIDSPRVDFTKDAVEPADVQKDTVALRDLLRDLMPLQINRVEAHEGTVRYLDPHSRPKVDVKMDHLELLALNLRNSYDSTELLPASIRANADVYGGTFAFDMRLDPLATDPRFDMNVSMKGMQLTRVNDFLQAYAKVDVNRGTFGLYAELATRDREFTGYVKPIVNDLDVLGPEDRHDSFLHKLWEGLVGTAGTLLTNPPHDQVATKVEFSGKLDGPRVDTWYAVIDLLRNAFIRALEPSIDHEISILNVGATPEEKPGFFKRLFGGDDAADERRKDRKKAK